jgi:hypothetical protein
VLEVSGFNATDRPVTVGDGGDSRPAVLYLLEL